METLKRRYHTNIEGALRTQRKMLETWVQRGCHKSSYPYIFDLGNLGKKRYLIGMKRHCSQNERRDPNRCLIAEHGYEEWLKSQKEK